MASGVDRRFALVLLARAGTRPRRVLLALMAGTAALSSIMSDVPVCAIFMAVALGIFARAKVAPGSAFGKSVMMGIPIAALIGGVATPAGSAINILGLYFIEEYGTVRVPFLSWSAIGIPMVLVLTPVAWWVLCRFFPPEMESVGSAEDVRAELAALGGWTSAEKKVLGLLADGMSNRDIAERLYLTRKTVEHHVHNVLVKLDLRNRAEAAAYAARHGAADPATT